MELEILLNCIRNYSLDERVMILHAYEFANLVHKGVKRKSGEDYIKHPLAVACILARMNADADTIAAGLLHDTIEDGDNITKDLIAQSFNPTVAMLVDGVTKMKKIDFDNDKNATDAANMRKIIESITYDIRIFVIKLADRLHNMRTLEFHKKEKQVEISLETMELFVPFANLIGEYAIQLELEDLAFKYINPQGYVNTLNTRANAETIYRRTTDRMLTVIAKTLNMQAIDYEFRVKLKNVYGLYSRLKTFRKMENIHDLMSITILVDDVDTCYKVRDLLMQIYTCVPSKTRDYIKQPKTNMYQSLHLGAVSDGRVIQIQIATKAMHKVNQYGLAAYWKLLSDNQAAAKMQDDLRNFQFYGLLTELSTLNLSNDSYNKEVRDSLLVSRIYVYTPKGDVIELSEGSTVVDFAYKIHTEIGESLIGATVNGVEVDIGTVLHNDDVVEVAHNNNNTLGLNRDLTLLCHNESTKRKIRELKKKLGTA